MERKGNASCRRIREALQDLHDQRREPPRDISAHLASCRECARFKAFLERLGADALASIEAPLASLPAPDVAAVIRRAQECGRGIAARTGRASSRRRSSPVLAWLSGVPRPLQAAAALLIVAVGIVSGLLLYGGYREQAELRASVSLLVDDLFGSSALDGAEFGPAADLPDLDALVAATGD